MRLSWRHRASAPKPSPPVVARPPAEPAPPDLSGLEADARYHRDRLSLYRARMHGAHATSVERLTELEKASALAEDRLSTARRLARAP